VWRNPKAWAALAAVVSVCAWIPMWVKAFATHSTRDYSLGMMAGVVLIELLQLRIACLQRDPLFRVYMAGKAILAAASLGLVLYFSR